MRQGAILAAGAALAFVMSSGVVLADRAGADWIGIDRVAAILRDNGYTRIDEIEADDGHWEGKGVKDGKRYKFHIDPHSGKLTRSRPTGDDDD
jgi:hypothetical protein